MRHLIRGLALSLLLATLPLAAEAGVLISVSIGPRALPVYVAPPMPAPGYFWTPGYWAYADAGYYWVPGTWVMAPAPGVLWTPGYWGWSGGAYLWHGGYWGPHVGFYGGINYGFGYGGAGFNGGAWQGGRYVANTTVINNTTIVNNTTINRTSFNGGTGGVVATPTAEQAHFAQEQHIPPSAEQQQHEVAASHDTTMRASYNHGSPSVAATAKPGVFYGKGVVAAHAPGAGGGGAPHPVAMHENITPHGIGGAQPGHPATTNHPTVGSPGHPAPASHPPAGAPHGAPPANAHPPQAQGHASEHASGEHAPHGGGDRGRR